MVRERHVYFLRPVGQPGPVKIGCSEAPKERLQTFMTWSPFPLEIAAFTPGWRSEESCLQSMFAADHSHGEWFHASERLTALIEAVAEGVPLDNLLDRSVARVNFANYVVRANPEWRRWKSYAVRMTYAFRRLRTDGAEYDEPDRAAEILDRWQGWDGRVLGAPTAPSAEEIAYLDAVLANPAAHAERTPAA
jgi:hypothetical protein